MLTTEIKEKQVFYFSVLRNLRRGHAMSLWPCCLKQLLFYTTQQQKPSLFAISSTFHHFQIKSCKEPEVR